MYVEICDICEEEKVAPSSESHRVCGKCSAEYTAFKTAYLAGNCSYAAIVSHIKVGVECPVEKHAIAFNYHPMKGASNGCVPCSEMFHQFLDNNFGAEANMEFYHKRSNYVLTLLDEYKLETWFKKG